MLEMRMLSRARAFPKRLTSPQLTMRSGFDVEEPRNLVTGSRSVATAANASLHEQVRVTGAATNEIGVRVHFSRSVAVKKVHSDPNFWAAI
jgi:hypothetical protein